MESVPPFKRRIRRIRSKRLSRMIRAGLFTVGICQLAHQRSDRPSTLELEILRLHSARRSSADAQPARRHPSTPSKAWPQVRAQVRLGTRSHGRSEQARSFVNHRNSYIPMKNALAILVMTIQTFIFFVGTSVYITGPARSVGHRLYFGFVGFPELLEVVLASAWSLFILHLGPRFLSGTTRRWLCVIPLAFLVLLFLDYQGAFVISNYGFDFFSRLVPLTVLLAAGLWCASRVAKRWESVGETRAPY